MEPVQLKQTRPYKTMTEKNGFQARYKRNRESPGGKVVRCKTDSKG